MLFLISPAKSLDYDTPVPAALPATQPHFEGPRGPAAELIKLLRQKSPQQIAELMHLSDKLSALNVARYAAWASKGTPEERQAGRAGLRRRCLRRTRREDAAAPAQLAWAQDHVCILSGLYGVLRPLDRLQPYRLEMGTQLANRPRQGPLCLLGLRASPSYLNERLAADRTPVVINLASQEYFKSVDQKVLKARVVECVFEEWKGGQLQDHQLLRQARARPDGALGRAAQGRHAQGAGEVRPRGLCLRCRRVDARAAGVSARKAA